MSPRSSDMDVDELLMLAARATRRDETQRALDYVSRALQLQPTNAAALHLRGGLHASLRDYGRALQDFERAVECDPDLGVARFQLGLLHLTSGRITEADAAWQRLDELAESHPLRLFKQGMLHLVRDEFQDCLEALQRGMTANRENQSLNRDMQVIVTRVQAALEENAGSASSQEAGR